MSSDSDSSRDLLMRLVELLQNKGKERVEELAEQGKKRLALRSLRKDKNKMYEKLGKEVERLVEAGEIHHPGLMRGVERIADLAKKIEEAQQSMVEKSPEK